MKAAVRDRYGSPDVVELRDIERPVPAGDQVLVRVEAASVNRADLDGIYPKPEFVRLLFGVRRPRNPRSGSTWRASSIRSGPPSTRFKPGDRVFADLYPFSQGAFAEYVAAPERAFALIPPEMSFEVAATIPHSAILAIQGLRRRDGRTVGPGDRVLIDGASGNVGPFAVQIAKSRGAEVTGVCSPAKMDFVRSLGADHVLDYTAVDYTRTGERYDWIVDTDSHHSIPRIRRALRPKGVYVTLGGTGAGILAAMTVGLAASLATDKSMGLMLWWKPFARRRRRGHRRARRGGHGDAGDRPAVSAGRGRRGAALRRRRARPRQGDRRALIPRRLSGTRRRCRQAGARFRERGPNRG